MGFFFYYAFIVNHQSIYSVSLIDYGSYYHSLFKRIDRKLYICKSEFQTTKMLFTEEMKGNRCVEDI